MSYHSNSWKKVPSVEKCRYLENGCSDRKIEPSVVYKIYFYFRTNVRFFNVCLQLCIWAMNFCDYFHKRNAKKFRYFDILVDELFQSLIRISIIFFDNFFYFSQILPQTFLPDSPNFLPIFPNFLSIFPNFSRFPGFVTEIHYRPFLTLTDI